MKCFDVGSYEAVLTADENFFNREHLQQFDIF